MVLSASRLKQDGRLAGVSASRASSTPKWRLFTRSFAPATSNLCLPLCATFSHFVPDCMCVFHLVKKNPHTKKKYFAEGQQEICFKMARPRTKPQLVVDARIAASEGLLFYCFRRTELSSKG
jgi:hypothetical protein